MSGDFGIFRNLTVVLGAIKPEDLVDLPMTLYLAMVNNITGEQLEQIEDFNLRALLFCQLHRKVWTTHCGPMGASNTTNQTVPIQCEGLD